MLLLEPEVLAIQWPYPFSGPSTLISAKCCWRAVKRPLKNIQNYTETSLLMKMLYIQD